MSEKLIRSSCHPDFKKNTSKIFTARFATSNLLTSLTDVDIALYDVRCHTITVFLSDMRLYSLWCRAENISTS